jgi:hypothetical protein
MNAPPLLNLVVCFYSAVNTPPPLFTMGNRRLHGRPLKPPAPLPPSGPIKGGGLHPTLTALIPLLLPSSPRSNIATSELLSRRRLAVAARPPRRLASPGERRTGFTVLPSPHPTLVGELPSSGAVRDRTPASMLPRSGGLRSTPPSGPWWTEPPVVHEPWTESTIIFILKIIPKPEKSPPFRT